MKWPWKRWLATAFTKSDFNTSILIALVHWSHPAGQIGSVKAGPQPDSPDQETSRSVRSINYEWFPSLKMMWKSLVPVLCYSKALKQRQMRQSRKFVPVANFTFKSIQSMKALDFLPLGKHSLSRTSEISQQSMSTKPCKNSYPLLHQSVNSSTRHGSLLVAARNAWPASNDQFKPSSTLADGPCL